MGRQGIVGEAVAGLEGNGAFQKPRAKRNPRAISSAEVRAMIVRGPITCGAARFSGQRASPRGAKAHAKNPETRSFGSFAAAAASRILDPRDGQCSSSNRPWKHSGLEGWDACKFTWVAAGRWMEGKAFHSPASIASTAGGR